MLTTPFFAGPAKYTFCYNCDIAGQYLSSIFQGEYHMIRILKEVWQEA